MSAIAVKRSKISHGREYQTTQFQETNSREDHSRSEEELEGESKSEETPDSQEIPRTTRTSAAGRRRKKKVFADYYYGDEIFPKSKNGNKKKANEKKSKVRGKYKTQKKENMDDSKKVYQKKTYKKTKRAVTHQNELKSSELITTNNGAFKNSQSLSSTLLREGGFTNQGQEFQGFNPTMSSLRGLSSALVSDAKVYPVKPVPQRQGGSNLDFLLNAYKMSNPTKINPNPLLDETLKKREDKALEKQVQNILSNSENPLKMSQPSMGIGRFQDTLNAILKSNSYPGSASLGNNIGLLQNSSEGRKSSSEMEENLKHKTPVKTKKRKEYDRDDYSSSQENGEPEPYFMPKKNNSYMMRTPKKEKNCRGKEKESPERVSRVKSRLVEGEKVRLLIDSNGDPSTQSITFHIGKKNLTDDFNSGISCPNLNKLVGATSSIGPIMMNMKQKLVENFMAKEEETSGRKEMHDPSDPRLYSIPLLWSSIAE